ncbi:MULTISPECIES: hypothetical protein [unclassified Microbacterium]|uniref:hypothetical protein n=1 Tax=unclassified Microbacterium TaxID=2609290 RepID=UPI00343778B8
MYEHPYLAYKVTEYDQEQLQRAAERRRFLAEHADQIVPRGAGPLRRVWERMLRGSAARRSEATQGGRSAVCEPASAR